MENMTKFAISLTNGEWEANRAKAMNEKLEKDGHTYMIDTCNTADCGHETGIKKDDEGWVIVEEYPDREASVKGHKSWIAKIKKNPNLKLEDCRNALGWAFGD